MPQPPEPEIVRASGFCCLCDSRFSDEVVLRFREPALPGGWGYIELRHLEVPSPVDLALTRTADCAGQRRWRIASLTSSRSGEP
jgi:hypothetical protein